MSELVLLRWFEYSLSSLDVIAWLWRLGWEASELRRWGGHGGKVSGVSGKGFVRMQGDGQGGT